MNEIIRLDGEIVEDTQLATVQPMPARMVEADTDEQLIDLFIATKGSEATKKTYTTALEQFMAFTNYKRLAVLTLEDMVKYRDHLRQRYSSAHTCKLKLNSIKSLLTFAAKVQYLPFNVGAAIEADKAESVIEDKLLTEEQIILMIGNTENQRDNLLIRLLYASGGRVSEIAALTWADVQDGYIIIRHGKGNKQRRVGLSDDTLARLRTFRPIDATDADPIFTAKYRGQVRPMSRFTIYKQIQRIGARHGIDGLHPHMFRHSHGTHAIQNGAAIHVVRDTLGHSSIAITNNYLHAGQNESSAHSLKI